jgi:hypothetical protein
MNALSDKQAELDAIEWKLIENKQARLQLQQEAKDLRTHYLEVQEEREQLLKEELQGGAE